MIVPPLSFNPIRAPSRERISAWSGRLLCGWTPIVPLALGDHAPRPSPSRRKTPSRSLPMMAWASRCPPASPLSRTIMRPPARQSSVSSGCRPPSSNTISTMVARCTGSCGPSPTHIRTIIPRRSRPPSCRAGMSRRSSLSTPTAAGVARSSSGCRGRDTGFRPATFTASWLCRMGSVGRSSEPTGTSARRCSGASVTRSNAAPGTSGGGANIDRPSSGGIVS